MKNIIFPVLISLTLGTSSMLYADGVKWSYSGETGSEHWADLSPDYATCGNGKNQSPINIDSHTALVAQNRSIKFNYGHITPDKITNTGNFIQVDVGAGANIDVDGNRFELKHLNIHMPSENTYNNEHFAMEIQFVHENKDKELVYLSMMGDLSQANRTLNKLLAQMPTQAGESKALAANSLRNVEMKKRIGKYYRYNGSMTTPPCTEGVRWFILKQALTLSVAQQQQFKNVIKQANNRPTQALNARVVTK